MQSYTNAQHLERAVTVAVQEGRLTTGAAAFSRGTQPQTTRSFAGREMENALLLASISPQGPL